MTYHFGPQKESFAFNSEFNDGEQSAISAFAWPGEVSFETAQPKRKSVGTDCGRSGAPAASVNRPGGRCIGPTPPICPSVAGILSIQGIGNIPFEYVAKVALDNSTRLMAVTRRLRPRTQRFLPSVQRALTQFVDNMNRFRMPIEAILTAGSYCCRCISRTNSLSNHSFADAFDLVGVRWSGGRETIVHNWRNPAERARLRRINACLRLSFANVIDYHRADHRDHFHCDMNRGNPRNTRRTDTLRFTQEALSLVLRRAVPVTGKFDQTTQRALVEFGGTTADALKNSAHLNQILDRLFKTVAAPPAGVTSGEGELSSSGTPATAARASLAGDMATWIRSTDRSAIELVADETQRCKFLQQVDWSREYFPGNLDAQNRKAPGRLAEALFQAMARVVPERRVPTSIRFRDVTRVVVSVPGQPGHKLFPEARESFVRMSAAAAAEGVQLQVLSSWRSLARQQAARLQQANPNAVARGISAHNYGLAIDLNMRVAGLSLVNISTRARDKMANVVRMYRSPNYKWLAINASRFGWFPYRREPWHWEYNPPGFKERFEGATGPPTAMDSKALWHRTLARYLTPGKFESQESEYGAPLNLLSPTELKAVKITSTFETGRTGGFGGLSGNFDGQGLSFGLLNFTIKAGSLIPLLQEFISKHPSRYSSAFGNDAGRFKEIVFASKPDPKNPKRRIRDVERQMEFVNNRMNAIPREARGNKIIEPWKTYFGRLETDPEFQKIQVKAVRGALNRARYWCDYFGFKTERGFAFMFDLVSSHGGAWLNAKKFQGKRRALLRKMLAAKQAQVGREKLTELEKMEVIANMIAEVSSEKWRDKVRIRKLWFVRGTGKVHGTVYDIKKHFGITDNASDFGTSQQRGAGTSYESNQLISSLDQETVPSLPLTKLQAEYEDTLAKISSQLNLRFSSPTDQGLLVRRQELIRLFKLVPAPFAKTLYNQLQDRRDPLSRLFHGALAPITCTVLLRELQKKMASVANVPSGPGPLQPDPQTVVLDLIVSGKRLPAALEPQFREAADRFISLMVQNVFDQKVDPDAAETLICLLNLLLNGADDKLVLFGERCDIYQLKRNPGNMCIQPVIRFLIEQKSLKSKYNSTGLSLLTHHLKPILLNIHLVKPGDDVVGLLLLFVETIQREVHSTVQTLAQLFAHATAAQKREYNPILFEMRNFVRSRQAYPKSIYSCFN